jgi:hypothetical protein
VAGFGHAQNSSADHSSAKSPSKSEEKAKLSADRVILKVGGVKVTEKEYEATIGDIEPEPRDPDEPETGEKSRRDMGEDYASVLMLSQMAVVNGLDKTPEIRRQLTVNRLQILSDAQFAKMKEAAQPSKVEMQKYYDSHLADLDRLKLRRLFIWKTGQGSTNTKGLAPDAARTMADQILHSTGEEGAQLADRVKGSDEGLYDPEPLTFLRHELSPRFEKAAFAAKPGEWSQADDTKDQIVLLHIIERDRRPFAEVESVVDYRVRNEKLLSQLEALKKKTGIWMDDQYFGASVAEDPGEQRPVSDQPSKPRNSEEKQRGEIQ